MKYTGNLFVRIIKTAMWLPKPLSKAHLERLARDKRWADLAEEADKRHARARSSDYYPVTGRLVNMSEEKFHAKGGEKVFFTFKKAEEEWQ